jgi:hypothetical protein
MDQIPISTTRSENEQIEPEPVRQPLAHLQGNKGPILLKNNKTKGKPSFKIYEDK